MAFSIMKLFARGCARMLGWTVDMEKPEEAKYVLIAAPHTTNWDLFFMLLASVICGFRASWVGKESLFRWPMGWVLRVLGGIAINRSGGLNTVDTLAGLFKARERLILAIPPEGTRGKAPHWKSGFYFVAKKAGVPICLGYLDYKNKRAGLGPLIHPSGDLKADMDLIRAFYAGKTGLYPQNQGPIRLEQEDESPANSTADRAIGQIQGSNAT